MRNEFKSFNSNPENAAVLKSVPNIPADPRAGYFERAPRVDDTPPDLPTAVSTRCPLSIFRLHNGCWYKYDFLKHAALRKFF